MILKRLLLNAAPLESNTPAAPAPTADNTPASTPTAPAAGTKTPVGIKLSAPKDGFSVSDSDEVELLGDAAGPADVKADKKAETPKPDDKKEVVTPPKEDKKEDKKEEQVITGPNLLKTLDEKKVAGARDYSGYSDEEVKVLKSMSNDAFNYVAPILKSRKELERLKDATYLQHPESYTLHPEYREKQQLVFQAKREAAAWQEILVQIRKGEDWTPIVGVDEHGEFIYGEKRKPTVADEEQVRLARDKCVRVEEAVNQQLRTMPQQFQQQVTQDNQMIQAERARRFDWVADPKLMSYELETPEGKKTIGNIRDSFINLFPVYHRKSPGVEVAADLWVTNQILQSQLKVTEKEKVVAETLKEEANRVEVTSSSRDNGANKGKLKEFSLDGLPE